MVPKDTNLEQGEARMLNNYPEKHWKGPKLLEKGGNL